LLLGHADFLRFTAKQFVFLSGTMLSVPLFPLYFVRVVNASNAWIGIINTAQTAVLLIGYFLWTRGSKLRGSRFVLLWTTLGLAFYPALVAATQQVFLIAILAGIAGIFQAGVNLVFFDELMKTVPPKQSATFVSIAQSLQYLPAIVAPLFGSLLANWIGIGGALLVSAGLRLLGFILFASGKPETAPSRELSPSS
jgi:MFS family permease